LEGLIKSKDLDDGGAVGFQKGGLKVPIGELSPRAYSGGDEEAAYRRGLSLQSSKGDWGVPN